jgi:hypothetical protein
MKTIADSLRWLIWTPIYFLFSLIGPLLWAAICAWGVALVVSVIALPIYLLLHLVCCHCASKGLVC